MSRPKTITFDRGDLEFRYSPTTGLLDTLIAPGNNRLRYTYDGSLPKSVTWSGDVSGSVSVNYDNNFRVTSQLVNGANSVSFGYSNDGLLTGVGSMTIYRDTDNGRIDSTLLGNVRTNQSYNEKGEMASYAALYNSTTLFATTYERDSLGRITELEETVQGVTNTFAYAYDTTGRLQEVWRNDTLISTYTYDGNGNRLSHIVGTDTTYATYDDQDRLLTYGDASYTYTDNGELRTKVVGSDTTEYTYDAFGNLTRVDLPNGDVVEYVIDGQNRRVAKKVNGTVLRKWLYGSQLTPVAELDSINNIVARFVGGFLIKSGATYRIIRDNIGSLRLVINTTTGAIAQRLDYDEFGNIISNSSPDFQPLGYAGGLTDTHTGIVRFGIRDYDATSGRWLSKDPLGLRGGRNLFVYVSNDPINTTDITGLWPTKSILFAPLVHQNTIDRALPFLSEDDRRILKETQVIQDNLQDPVDQFIHAMRDGTAKPPQTVAQARALANWYVRHEILFARELACNGNRSAALVHLGNAIHTLQDATSPTHAGFQPWSGSGLGEEIPHGYGEYSPTSTQQQALDLVTIRALGYFYGTLKLPEDFFE